MAASTYSPSVCACLQLPAWGDSRSGRAAEGNRRGSLLGSSRLSPVDNECLNVDELQVTYDPTSLKVAQICAAVEDAGFDATLISSEQQAAVPRVSRPPCSANMLPSQPQTQPASSSRWLSCA